MADALSNIIAYRHDAGRRTAVTNAREYITTYSYDELGRLEEIHYPDDTRETYTYDEVGNRETREDGKGDVTTYTYDNVNRNTLVDYPSGADTTFTYDAVGRRTKMEDGVGTTSWAYDAIGRLTEVDDPYSKVVSYNYDVRGRKTTMGLSGVGLTTYCYDSRGRLRTIDNPYAETTTYSYDALSRTSRQDNDNGTFTTWSYGTAGWMTGVTNRKSDATVISSFGYNYDEVGNRTWVTEANGDKVTWSYDNTYQLTRERRDGDYSYDVTYTYDAVGNRATKLAGGVTTTYTYNAANKMTKFDDNSGITTFTYDGNGNQVTKEVPEEDVTTYAYKFENKMVGITYPDQSLNTFTYDGEGKRLQKQDSAGTLRSVYDHQGPTGLYDLAAETNNEGTLQAFYTQGPMLISQRRGGNSYWYHDDALGSTAVVTNSDETATSTYKYYAFGDLRTSSGTLTNPFKYAGGLGYYDDPDSGLLLLRARYYSPAVARFVSRDPLMTVADTAEPWASLLSSVAGEYGYAGNNPASGMDPSGLWDTGPVHWQATMTWGGARDARYDCGWGMYGLSAGEVSALGLGDREIDQPPYKAVWWDSSTWGYHVNVLSTVPHAPTDSRKGWFSLCYGRAVHMGLVHRSCITAARELGRGLHAMQDFHSHGPVTPYEHQVHNRWVHNKGVDTNWVVGRYWWVPWPLRFLNYGNAWARQFDSRFDPGEPRLRKTQVMTKHYVRQFLRDVCCRCGVLKP